MTFPTDDEAQAMTNDELLAQINGHDPYDVEFARRFRELEARAALALSLAAEAYEVAAASLEERGSDGWAENVMAEYASVNAEATRALIPSDAIAARESRDKRVRYEALREAAETVREFGENGTLKSRMTKADGSPVKRLSAQEAISHGEWIADCAAREILTLIEGDQTDE